MNHWHNEFKIRMDHDQIISDQIEEYKTWVIHGRGLIKIKNSLFKYHG